MVIRWFFDGWALSFLFALGVVVVIATWRHFCLPGNPMSPMWLLGTCVISAAVSLLAVAVRRPSLMQVASRIDELGGTKDRLLMSLVLDANEGAKQSPLSVLAREECLRFLDTRDFRPLISLRPSPALGWVVVPLIAWGLIRWQDGIVASEFHIEKEQAQQLIAPTTRLIEQLAEQAKKAAEDAKSEDLHRLAEQLQRSGERLHSEVKSDDAEKSALSELSKLQELMRELQRQPSPADEMKELAKALASLPGMQDVLNALNEKDLAEAQRAMERAMEEQNEQKPDQLSEEQAEKQLQQAIQRMSEQRRLSEALQQFAEKMKEHQGRGLSQQAMRQLQQMMQQMSRQGDKADSDSGQQQREMTLQEMIAALENMKFGDEPGNADQGSNSQQIPGGPRVSIQSFGSANPQGNPQSGDAKQPSGRPGSERDFGTTDTPFGGKSDAQDKGGELALKGRLGQGESLSMMLPSAGDNSKAARRYQDLYDSAAAAAQDTVEQENIPLGSRLLIKRYFQSIRPRE